jgi:hypothetical protein
MERRHFQVIADIIRLLPVYERTHIAAHFAKQLGRTNIRFDHERFLSACGVSREVNT